MTVKRFHAIRSSPISRKQRSFLIVESSRSDAAFCALPYLNPTKRDQRACGVLFFNVDRAMESLTAIIRERFFCQSGLLEQLSSRRNRSHSAEFNKERNRERDNQRRDNTRAHQERCV